MKRRPRALWSCPEAPSLLWQVLFNHQIGSAQVRGPWHFRAAHWELLPFSCPSYLAAVQREARAPGI